MFLSNNPDSLHGFGQHGNTVWMIVWVPDVANEALQVATPRR
jgi:hypothetical protein